jgi:hypothetical protein
MALMAPRTPQDLPKGVQKGSKRGPKQVILGYLEVSETLRSRDLDPEMAILRSIQEGAELLLTHIPLLWHHV